MKEKESKHPKELDRKDRRKRLNQWIDMNYLHSQTGKSRPVGGGSEIKIKVMDNSTRRKLGISQDPDLPDYKESL